MRTGHRALPRRSLKAATAGMSSSRVTRKTLRGLSKPRAMSRVIHEFAAFAREKPETESLDSTRLTALAEIEYAGRLELALLDVANGNQVPLAGCIGGTSAHRRVPATDQHGLPPQQPGRIVLPDGQRG